MPTEGFRFLERDGRKERVVSILNNQSVHVAQRVRFSCPKEPFGSGAFSRLLRQARLED